MFYDRKINVQAREFPFEIGGYRPNFNIYIDDSHSLKWIKIDFSIFLTSIALMYHKKAHIIRIKKSYESKWFCTTLPSFCLSLIGYKLIPIASKSKKIERKKTKKKQTNLRLNKWNMQSYLLVSSSFSTANCQNHPHWWIKMVFVFVVFVFTAICFYFLFLSLYLFFTMHFIVTFAFWISSTWLALTHTHIENTWI